MVVGEADGSHDLEELVTVLDGAELVEQVEQGLVDPRITGPVAHPAAPPPSARPSLAHRSLTARSLALTPTTSGRFGLDAADVAGALRGTATEALGPVAKDQPAGNSASPSGTVPPSADPRHRLDGNGFGSDPAVQGGALDQRPAERVDDGVEAVLVEALPVLRPLPG